MNGLVIGGGSSLVDLKKLRNNFTHLSVMSSSPLESVNGIDFYSVDWKEDFDVGQLSTKRFDVVYFLNGAWLPGRLKKLNKNRLIDLLNINVFTPYEILRDLDKNRMLDENCKIVLVSSKSAETVDPSAPEYSLAKLCVEKVFQSYCNTNNYQMVSKRFGFISGSTMHKKAADRYGISATETIEEVRMFLEAASQ